MSESPRKRGTWEKFRPLPIGYANNPCNHRPPSTFFLSILLIREQNETKYRLNKKVSKCNVDLKFYVIAYHHRFKVLCKKPLLKSDYCLAYNFLEKGGCVTFRPYGCVCQVATTLSPNLQYLDYVWKRTLNAKTTIINTHLFNELIIAKSIS